MSFLPRYLSGMTLPGGSVVAYGTILTAGVLWMGCAGQIIAGRIDVTALSGHFGSPGSMGGSNFSDANSDGIPGSLGAQDGGNRRFLDA